MVASPFIQLPFSLPNPSGIQLDPTKVSPFFPTVAEVGAKAHWLLGDDNPLHLDLLNETRLRKPQFKWTITGGTGYTTAPILTLVGGNYTGAALACRVSGGVIVSVSQIDWGADGSELPTVQVSGGGGSGASIALSKNTDEPTLNAGSITLPATSFNGLASPYPDDVDQTQFGVFRFGSGQHILMGAWADVDTGSSILYRSGAGVLTDSIRQSASATSGTNVPVAPPSAGSGSEWFWVAVSQSATRRRVKWGGGSFYERAVTKYVGNIKPKNGIGHAAGGLGFASAFACAEYGFFDRELTEAEMIAVYTRSTARLADRGIGVV